MMRTSRLAAVSALALSLAVAEFSSAQVTPPKSGKGQTVKTLATLELSTQLPELAGRYLRARMRTIQPGGNGLLHSHKDLPVILYIVSGTLSVCTPDGHCTDIPQDQAVAEGRDVTHWAANKGPAPVKYLVVEIGREP